MAAHEATLKTRQEEIAKFWHEHGWSLTIALFVGFLVGFLFIPLWEILSTNLNRFVESLLPGAVGIGFTVVFIDVLYRRREEQRRIKDLQEQLVRDASSTRKDVAVNAVHQMRKHNDREWLTGDDGLFKGADLRFANLERANLGDAYFVFASPVT